MTGKLRSAKSAYRYYYRYNYYCHSIRAHKNRLFTLRQDQYHMIERYNNDVIIQFQIMINRRFRTRTAIGFHRIQINHATYIRTYYNMSARRRISQDHMLRIFFTVVTILVRRLQRHTSPSRFDLSLMTVETS